MSLTVKRKKRVYMTVSKFFPAAIVGMMGLVESNLKAKANPNDHEGKVPKTAF